MAFDPKREAKKFIDVEIEAPHRGPGRPRKPTESPTAEAELREIKNRVEGRFAYETGPMGELDAAMGRPLNYPAIEKSLSAELDGWRSRWGSSVNVERAMHDVFLSDTKAGWDPSPDVKRLAQQFAGVQS